MKQAISHDELTHQIIGCSMQVHNQIGNGFQEVIYQRALEIELSLNRLPFAREVEMPVFYKGHEIGTRRVDFLIQDTILVELKSIIKLEDVHMAQAKNYLEAFNLPTGLLINFGSIKLEIKRLFNNKVKS